MAQKTTKIGIVVSDKMTGTAVVKVSTSAKHPLYGKRYTISKKFKVDNPGNKYKVGDKVVIQETRPLSKTKNFEVIELLVASVAANDNKSAAAAA